MNHPIIVRREVTDFLRGLGFKQIYKIAITGTSPLLLEVWSKEAMPVTVKGPLDSDLVWSIDVYETIGMRSCVHKNTFENQGRSLLSKVYSDISREAAKGMSKFPLRDWKLLFGMFSNEELITSETKAASFLLVKLLKLSPEDRKYFSDVIVQLKKIVQEASSSDVKLEAGTMLVGYGDQLYRFTGVKDKVGNYLLSSDEGYNFMTPEAFSEWRQVDCKLFLKKTMGAFACLFDSAYVSAVITAINTVLEKTVSLPDSVEKVCRPFSQITSQEVPIMLNHNEAGAPMGGYRLNLDEDFAAVCSFDLTGSYFCLTKKQPADVLEQGEISSFDLVTGTPAKSSQEAIKFGLGLLNKIYETFSFEIAALGLTNSFISLYQIWEIIHDSVQELDSTSERKLLEGLKNIRYEGNPGNSSTKANNHTETMDIFK